MRRDWLIKWNPRSVDTAQLLARLDADVATCWQRPRPGKRVTVWEESLSIEGMARPLRRILRLVERDIDRRGQQLIVPEVELQGWTTSLGAEQFDADKVIALYADHGTHEQFHSEFKTDLDLERLPSGKFDTNYLVCQLAAVAMNILRLMGQQGLLGPDAPVRHPAKRRRLKTVMQELIYKAGHHRTWPQADPRAGRQRPGGRRIHQTQRRALCCQQLSTRPHRANNARICKQQRTAHSGRCGVT